MQARISTALLAASVLLLAGCSDADRDRLSSYPPLGSQPTQTAAAPPAAPVAVSEPAAAPPPGVPLVAKPGTPAAEAVAANPPTPEPAMVAPLPHSQAAPVVVAPDGATMAAAMPETIPPETGATAVAGTAPDDFCQQVAHQSVEQAVADRATAPTVAERYREALAHCALVTAP